jgi:hypothetical protein
MKIVFFQFYENLKGVTIFAARKNGFYQNIPAKMKNDIFSFRRRETTFKICYFMQLAQVQLALILQHLNI